MIKVDCATRDFWKQFVTGFKKINKKVPVDMSTYRKVLADYNKEITKQLLDGATYKVPYKLGYLAIVRRPTRIGTTIKGMHALKKDFRASEEAGKNVYYLNEHTEYQYCQLYWFKPSLRSQKYIFKPCRSLARGIALAINNDSNHYKKYRVFINQDKDDL